MAIIAFFALPAHATLSFESTVSSGVYQDLERNTQWPVNLFWNLNHSTADEVETTLDMEASDQLYDNRWGFRLYQAYVSVPLARRFPESPFHRTRVQVGRQLLTEGFELSTMDGFQAPVYFTPKTNFWLVAGYYSAVDAPQTDFHSQIYGGSLRAEILETEAKGGYFLKRKGERFDHLAHGTLARELHSVPWRPGALVKGQWALQTAELDQALASLAFHPSDEFQFGFDGSIRQPRTLEAGESSGIYRLIATTPQRSTGTSASWRVTDQLTFDARLQFVTYGSQAGDESANQEDLSLTWEDGSGRWTPFLSRLKSWGGEAKLIGVRYRRPLSAHAEFQGELNAADIEKINRVSGTAWHARSGIGFRMGSQFFSQLLGELERNHFYSIDAKAIAYVSYFYY